jgi:hypothetical protein
MSEKKRPPKQKSIPPHNEPKPNRTPVTTSLDEQLADLIKSLENSPVVNNQFQDPYKSNVKIFNISTVSIKESPEDILRKTF